VALLDVIDDRTDRSVLEVRVVDRVEVVVVDHVDRLGGRVLIGGAEDVVDRVPDEADLSPDHDADEQDGRDDSAAEKGGSDPLHGIATLPARIKLRFGGNAAA